MDRSISPWSSFADEIFRRYGLILGAVATPVEGSSYVANGVVKVLAKGEGGPGNELPEPPRLCNFACVAALTFTGPCCGLEELLTAISLRRLVLEPERRAVSIFVGEMLYASRLGGDRSVRVVMVRVFLAEEGTGEEVAVAVAELLRPGWNLDKDAMCMRREVGQA